MNYNTYRSIATHTAAYKVRSVRTNELQLHELLIEAHGQGALRAHQ